MTEASASSGSSPVQGTAASRAERIVRNTKRAETYRDFSSGFLYPEAEELRTQHRQIFGHALSPDCPPYESEYGPSHVFQQTQTMADIAGFYRAFGVAPSDSKPERVDHLSTELEFMAYLAVKEAHAIETGRGEEVEICRDAQKKFLEDHLGCWVDAFAQALEKKTSGHYAELGRSLSDFIAGECRNLGAVPKKLEAGVAGTGSKPFGRDACGATTAPGAMRGDGNPPETFDACFSCGADEPDPASDPSIGCEQKDAGFSRGAGTMRGEKDLSKERGS